MYHIGHYAPDGEFRAGQVHVDRGQPGCFGNQPDLVEGFFKAADQHFTVEGGDDDLSVGGFDGTVYDDHVAVENAGAGHGVAADPHEEGGRLVPYQLFIEVDASFHIIVCRRTETGGV